MSRTLCPACAFSPIRDGAEACPQCGEPFAFQPMHRRSAKKQFLDRQKESVDTESTTFGGSLTGAVAAHPKAPAAVFTVGAVIWFIRAGGVLGDHGEPPWIYAVVGLDLILPMLLMINLGPAKVLCQLGALAQLGLGVFLAAGDFSSLRHVAFVAHAAVLLAMVTGEPGSARRSFGLLLGVMAAAAAVAAMVVGDTPPGPGSVEIDGREHRFRLVVPGGYQALAGEEMAPHLRLPLSTTSAKSFGFGNRVRRVYGVLTLNTDVGHPLIGGCQEHLRALGGTHSPIPLATPGPRALGAGALVYELRTASGAVGRMACGKLEDGRFAALAVVAQDPDPRIGAGVFERVGLALSFR